MALHDKTLIKCLNSLSDNYNCEVGLIQGEILTPFLFSRETIQDGITLDQLQLYLSLCIGLENTRANTCNSVQVVQVYKE